MKNKEKTCSTTGASELKATCKQSQPVSGGAEEGGERETAIPEIHHDRKIRFLSVNT